MSGSRTYDYKRDDESARRAAEKEAGPDEDLSTAVGTRSVSKLSPGAVLRLQRIAGSRAVSQALRAERLAIQRHAEGTELPTKEEDAAEVTDKLATAIPTNGTAPTEAPTTTAQGEAPPEQTDSNEAPPAATRTKKEEKAETEAGKKAGKGFMKTQKLNPGAMSLAGAESILQGAFGGIKKIVPGSVVILADQKACADKYDEVCIADGIINPDTGVVWAPGDCAKADAAAGVQTEGFAWKGVVYVNGKTTLVTATAHEILHNNTASGFRDKVGETFNEGVTEFLARKALKASGVKVPSVTAYPKQVELTKLLIDFVTEDTVTNAYFGGPDTLVKAFEDKSATTWDQLKTDAEALDTAKVKAALKKKKK